MRFLSLVRINEKSGLMPSEKLMQDMGKLMDEMTRDGTLVSTAGLRPTKEGVRVRSRYGKLSITEGPFTESKEVIGGWAILKADSKEEILRLTTEFMELHRTHWPEFEGECEVRAIEFQGLGS